MKQILVLFGGCSTEYPVSLQSACAVLKHMDRTCYTPLMVGITREGKWLYYTGALEAIVEDQWQRDACVPCTLLLDRGVGQPAGTVQGLLELTGVPVIGCGTFASAVCMDKDRAHQLAERAGVRVPRSALFRAGADMDSIQAAAKALGLPIFVKPVRSGSSFGITCVKEWEQLPGAVEAAFQNDREVLLEEAIQGFEVGCAVLGTETLTVGQVDEIELSQGFFDYEEKYTLKTSAIHCPARILPEQAHCPARILPEQAQAVQEAARKIYQALDCKGFARVDFFLTPQGEIVFNEVNTIPGFTDHSRYPNMMKGIGLEFPELIRRIIETEVVP